MPAAGFTDNLKVFGLTGQEAAIYESLLKNGAMSGYEVAKETGISRSNVYSSLAGLVEKGAAYISEGETSKYVPVSVKNFTENSLRMLSRKAEELLKTAPKEKAPTGGYLTINGTRHIKDKIYEMLKTCEKRLYIMADEKLIIEYDRELKELIGGGLKVVILTNGYKTDGATIYETQPDKGQIRFITDSSYVLTGTLTGDESDTCLYSNEPNLVEVMKEALKNKITILEKNLD
ncbi:MAG: TrmB family transcriptional regulator [Lachnospiraceae bacterium]|nr:TrmB family transcriptional regulator [Lachnospiraceae bacterium]